MKTLVLGANGFLGNAVNSFLQNRTKDSTTIANSDKFTKESQIRNLLNSVKPELVINCVAMIDSQACERMPKEANWVNGELPGIIAKNCKNLNSKLIHISTDAVMDTTKQFKCESETPNPDSTYGMSKLLGELEVINEGPDFLICRVNFFGLSRNKKSLLDFFQEKLLKDERVYGYTNVFFNPLGVKTATQIILELIERRVEGVIHITGNSRISKYEFGIEVEKIIKPGAKLIARRELATAGREKLRDLSLCNCKLREFITEIPDWKKDVKDEIRKGTTV